MTQSYHPFISPNHMTTMTTVTCPGWDHPPITASPTTATTSNISVTSSEATKFNNHRDDESIHTIKMTFSQQAVFLLSRLGSRRLFPSLTFLHSPFSKVQLRPILLICKNCILLVLSPPFLSNTLFWSVLISFPLFRSRSRSSRYEMESGDQQVDSLITSVP